MFTNFHSHTYYCDGKEHPENYIQKAIEQKLFAYGYSSHAPVNFETEWCIPSDRLNDYISDIYLLKEKYSQQIEVYLGLEIDYIPGIAGRNKFVNANVQLDYFIGSIHFVDFFPDNSPWNIDTSDELFSKGLKEIFNNDYKKAARRFYDITREMIRTDSPPVIGHLDKIKMFNTSSKYASEEESWYKNEVKETLKEIKKHGSMVEINTRGFYRYNQPDLYPSVWIIELMSEMNIPVVLSSDAHTSDEIISGFDYAIPILKRAGIEELFILKDGKWQSDTLPVTEHQ